MMLTKKAAWWIAWVVVSGLLGAWLAYAMLNTTADKSIFMPGELSPGHHQLVDDCGSCHIDVFGGGEVLQQACVDCHGEDRVKPFDSHPAKKFKDPRNAELMEDINALQCITCHTEHRPEITQKDGLTQPVDFCFHCHQDVAEERPSHEGMGFETCKDSGCHNFHNNRALYTNYLIKHLDEPSVLTEVKLPSREFIQRLEEDMDYPHDAHPVKVLSKQDIDAPDRVLSEELAEDWVETTHAESGVNCTACHVNAASAGVDGEANTEAGEGKTEAVWNDDPDHQACSTCHSVEVDRFMQGKHGMRLKQGLSPMTPAQARLPMKPAASHEELECNSCHTGHRFDVQQAAVESCLSCHDDEHSISYKQSAHFALWQKEVSGEAETGSGVSCASCHMPRIEHDINDWFSRTMVDHNQSANLSPNSKMARTTCMSCHGLGFSLDALADEKLINENFNGQPEVKVQSMDLAKQDQQRREQEAKNKDDDDGMFGF